MSLPMLRADWAQHAVYGAAIGSAAACMVSLLAMAAGRPGLALLQPLAAVLVPLAAGLLKEAADWWGNRKVRLRYENRWLVWAALHRYQDNRAEPMPPPPHEVSLADVLVTMLGGCAVAAPAVMRLWV